MSMENKVVYKQNVVILKVLSKDIAFLKPINIWKNSETDIENIAPKELLEWIKNFI